MAETTEIRGIEFTIDHDAMKTWKAFNLFRRIDESGSVFEKADATFALCEMVCGKGAEDLVGLCGGDDADMDEVLGFALEIIKAATPKN